MRLSKKKQRELLEAATPLLEWLDKNAPDCRAELTGSGRFVELRDSVFAEFIDRRDEQPQRTLRS